MELRHENGTPVFDHAKIQKKSDLPTEFVWPKWEVAQDEFNEPLIDLQEFINGDERATAETIKLVREACLRHGVFQIINHGVDVSLLEAAIEETDSIFKLPLERKLSIPKKPGVVGGYSGAQAERFATNLSWKETFTFAYRFNDAEPGVVNYFKYALGQDFEGTGRVYQKYCETMKKLSEVIFELLAVSLGVDRMFFRKFYEDGSAIMRLNFYPDCINPTVALGTRPHCDPNSLTILYQEQVPGLNVLSNDKWFTVRPRTGALVVNIGDTFTALSNGKYKSCQHRAVVNGERARRSLAYFVNPKEDKVVRPPQELIGKEGARLYPDFTWTDMWNFTQKHYRADLYTLQSYINWASSSKNV